MKNLSDVLREAGLSATRQRTALLKALLAADGPRSADSFAKQLARSMNMTTVYRVLAELTRSGIVRRLDFGKNHALYETALNHHHHLVCRSCGLVEDVAVCLPETLVKRVVADSRSFRTIEDHALEFFGVCAPCSKV